jgi:NAD(P)-dependent dehydrogenase (short-subunit alcohol dehydrogenase family)
LGRKRCGRLRLKRIDRECELSGGDLLSRSHERFRGKGVVVTGGGHGIGRSVAEAFATEGAGVVILDIDAHALASTAAEIRATGAEIEVVTGDVSRREDVRKAIDVVVDRFGQLDAAVQVAGVGDSTPFLEVTDETWDRVIDVNLTGTWYLVQEAGRAMIRQGIAGAIVVTTSTNAFQPEAGGLCYNTSKSGQIAVMRTSALELSRHGVRVNAIAPGIINTRLAAFIIDSPDLTSKYLRRIPSGRFGQPREVAGPILWMCSDDASYMSGELIVVDGAMTVGFPTRRTQ